MTPKDVWTALAVRLYLFIGASIKAFRFVFPMLSPCESTDSERAEDNPTKTKNKKKLTRLVPLACDVAVLKATWGNFVPCSLWDEFKSKFKHKYAHLPERTTKYSKGMNTFRQNEPENFPVRQATTRSVRCTSPRAVSTISLLPIWALRSGIGGDSWRKRQCQPFWLKSVELLRNLSAAVKSSTDLTLTETPRGNWAWQKNSEGTHGQFDHV